MPADSLATSLRAGLAQLGTGLDEHACSGMLEFVALLEKWNRVYNLTAVRDPQQMLTHHILDSLAILPYVHGPRVLDIGSGAGLPGIPLALARPDLAFVLLDSNSKKTRFMLQAVAMLGLGNVEVIQARVETYQAEPKFDTLITRAFGSLVATLSASVRLRAPTGEFLAMKGVDPVAELKQLPPGFRLAAMHRLVVPGIAGERHIVRITMDGGCLSPLITR